MPGVTSAFEAGQILDGLPFIKEYNANHDNGRAWFDWTRDQGSGGRIELYSGCVTRIWLPPVATFSAGAVIEEHGEPEVIQLSFRGVESMYLQDVGFWYPKQGLVIYVSATYHFDGVCLNPDAPAYVQFYGAPGELDDFITGLHLTSDEEDMIEREMVPGHGFMCSDSE